MKKINLACIIDDDPIFIFGTKRIMKLSNFCNDYLVFNNGRQALNELQELIKTQQDLPEVILLDLNMPIMDGWQFLDEITKTEITQRVTIFIVTSSIDPEDTKKAKTYSQISNYIVKPVTSKNLQKLLTQI
ncbi:Response regulator receiver domain-containing protein [Pustulibacterium marinum]|uniref:Response regulator receiver domain-containing protein n=1 Tax=Pustulibacterium marinum TaxID=1224947 RepID=A0A1I7GM43_9FLAO|nr:response regulator [Pustulibacterium marinum]SFU49572.1 Response regulator receiver domain-containing protein [Pustulibacterium marinum]